MSYHREVVQASSNIRNYLVHLQASYDNLFCGREMCEARPAPFDQTGFFLDNQLLNYNTPIAKNETMDLVTVTIGPSRVFLASMFTHAIVNKADILAFDQQLELCIIARMLNNPLRFYYSLESLQKCHKDESDGFQFHACVMCDWIEFSISKWGDWQGGGDDHLDRCLPSSLSI